MMRIVRCCKAVIPTSLVDLAQDRQKRRVGPEQSKFQTEICIGQCNCRTFSKSYQLAKKPIEAATSAWYLLAAVTSQQSFPNKALSPGVGQIWADSFYSSAAGRQCEGLRLHYTLSLSNDFDVFALSISCNLPIVLSFQSGRPHILLDCITVPPDVKVTALHAC